MWYDDWNQPRLTPLGFSRSQVRPGRRIPVSSVTSPARATPARLTYPPLEPRYEVAADPERVPEPELAPELAPEAAPELAPEPYLAPTPRSDAVRLREALVDLEASKRRLAEEQAREAQTLRRNLITELLPVLDNLDKSVAAAATSDPLIEGVELVRAQLEKVLAGYGAERFASTGEAFDPERHEAVAVGPVEDPIQDGTVIQEWKPGYRVGETVLRPAQVVVGTLATVL